MNQNSIETYENLDVWKISMELVKTVYEITAKFPEIEKFGLTNQMRRAVVSIPSNISEGYGRNGSKDYSRFLYISRGSAYELRTQVQISVMLGYINDETASAVREMIDRVTKMLTALIKRLESKGS